MEPASVTLSTIITDVGTIVNGLITWLGDFVDAVMANPLLEVFCLTGLAFAGVALFRRLIRV